MYIVGKKNKKQEDTFLVKYNKKTKVGKWDKCLMIDALKFNSCIEAEKIAINNKASVTTLIQKKISYFHVVKSIGKKIRFLSKGPVRIFWGKNVQYAFKFFTFSEVKNTAKMYKGNIKRKRVRVLFCNKL